MLITENGNNPKIIFDDYKPDLPNENGIYPIPSTPYMTFGVSMVRLMFEDIPLKDFNIMIIYEAGQIPLFGIKNAPIIPIEQYEIRIGNYKLLFDDRVIAHKYFKVFCQTKEDDFDFIFNDKFPELLL